MSQRKRATRKRKNEDASGGEKESEDTEKRGDRRKSHANKKYIGAHVGIQGGIWKAVEACTEIGGSSFALFLGSQRSWKRPELDHTAAAKFQELCSQQGFDPAHILPHGSYLMNCGSPKEGLPGTDGCPFLSCPVISCIRGIIVFRIILCFGLTVSSLVCVPCLQLDVFEKSQALLVDELSRCTLLGLSLYNFHPGSSLGTITTEQCVDKIASAINYAHQQTPSVVTVLENMSGQGSTVGGKFCELKSIIDRVRDQTRVGICLDTCHAFAAGYDLAAEGGVKAMLDEFDQDVGLRYLKAVHLNDSKGKLGCNLDRHEDIGKGHIGISAFRDIVNEPRLDNIPLILETPGRPGFEYAEQIELLYSLCEKK